MIETYTCTGCGQRGARDTLNDVVMEGHRHLLSSVAVTVPMICDDGMVSNTSGPAVDRIKKWCDGVWRRDDA